MIEVRLAVSSRGAVNHPLCTSVLVRASHGWKTGRASLIPLWVRSLTYGFAKGERENIAEDELTAFKQAAREYLALSDQQIDQLIAIEALIEVNP